MPNRIIYMGSPSFTIPVLNSLLSSPDEVVAVYTHPDREIGRGRKQETPPIKKIANDIGIEVYQPNTMKDIEVVRQIKKLKPDLIVIAAYGQILPKEILDVPRRGCLNIHPSLLPKHRGPSPVIKTLLEGDKETGVSIMLLDEGMDTGPILAQEIYTIQESDTVETLTNKLFDTGAQLLTRIIPRYLGGAIVPRKQDDALATYSRKIRKEDGEIDWTNTAEEIGRQIRALSPWPGVHTYWKGQALKVIEAKAEPSIEDTQGSIGQVITGYGQDKGAIGVVTAQGVLQIITVQQQGRNKNSAAAFLRGHSGFVGSVLPN